MVSLCCICLFLPLNCYLGYLEEHRDDMLEVVSLFSFIHLQRYTHTYRSGMTLQLFGARSRLSHGSSLKITVFYLILGRKIRLLISGRLQLILMRYSLAPLSFATGWMSRYINGISLYYGLVALLLLQGHPNNYCHPILQHLCMATFYSKSRSNANFRASFGETIPCQAMALLATAVC